MRIAYSECMSVALNIQHAKRVRHIVGCGLLGCSLSVLIILQTTRFSEEKLLNIRF